MEVIQNERIKKEIKFQDIEQATGIPSRKMFHFEKGIEHLSIDELYRLLSFLKLNQSLLLPPQKRLFNSKKMMISLAIISFVIVSLYLLFI